MKYLVHFRHFRHPEHEWYPFVKPYESLEDAEAAVNKYWAMFPDLVHRITLEDGTFIAESEAYNTPKGDGGSSGPFGDGVS